MPLAPKGLSKMQMTNTGGRYTPARQVIPPVNPHKKAEFDRNQKLLLALHEQEKIEYMKKMSKLQEKEKKHTEKRRELQDVVKSQVQERSAELKQYQKNYQLDKAVEALESIETMAVNDKKMNIMKIRRSVLNNLASRNKELEPNETYWQQKIIEKLGKTPNARQRNVSSIEEWCQVVDDKDKHRRSKKKEQSASPDQYIQDSQNLDISEDELRGQRKGKRASHKRKRKDVDDSRRGDG